MDNAGLISVIIPVYNVEKYLRQCVDSVLNQTYTSIEIILVDDGSTDRSGEICEEYAAQDGRVRCLHQENGGLSRARNEGFGLAHGEYVYFLDSDDWIEPDTIEKLWESAVRSGAQLVFFDAVSCDEAGEATVLQHYLRRRQHDTDTGLKVFSALQEGKDFHSAVPLLFLDREFLRQNELRFVEGIVYEDMLFTFQAFCLAERVAHVNRALYHRRFRTGSITRTAPDIGKLKSGCEVYLRAAAFAEAHALREPAVYSHIIRCAFNALDIYRRLPAAQKRICRPEMEAVKRNIQAHNAFGSRALRARCLGVIPWAAVRGAEKISTKLTESSDH